MIKPWHITLGLVTSAALGAAPPVDLSIDDVVSGFSLIDADTMVSAAGGFELRAEEADFAADELTGGGFILIGSASTPDAADDASAFANDPEDEPVDEPAEDDPGDES